MAEQFHKYGFAVIDLAPQLCQGGHHSVEGCICLFGIRTLEKTPLLRGWGDVTIFRIDQNSPAFAPTATLMWRRRPQ
jgi:hypothetical protein